MPFHDITVNNIEGFRDHPNFEQWCTEISSFLFEVNGCLSTLQQFIGSLESSYNKKNSTTKSVENINKKSISIIERTNYLIREIHDRINKINIIEETALNKSQLISREKLIRDVKFSVQEFQKYQLLFTDITKKINEHAESVVQEQQIILQNELERNCQESQSHHITATVERELINNEEFNHQQNLIRTRAEEIANIERSVEELNDIFQDLAVIVEQQGQIVDNIESNIYLVLNDTQSASYELGKAMKSQKRSNRWCLYILISLSLFLLLMVLAICT